MNELQLSGISMGSIPFPGEIMKDDNGNRFLITGIDSITDNGFSIESISGTQLVPAYTYGCSTSIHPSLTLKTVLKSLIEISNPEQSTIEQDDIAHFFEDGTLTVLFDVGRGNEIHIHVDQPDAVESCELAIEVLEQMKQKITAMQQKVFDLSLQQKVQR